MRPGSELPMAVLSQEGDSATPPQWSPEVGALTIIQISKLYMLFGLLCHPAGPMTVQSVTLGGLSTHPSHQFLFSLLFPRGRPFLYLCEGDSEIGSQTHEMAQWVRVLVCHQT